MMVSTVGVFEFEDEGALNAKQIDHNAPEDFDPAKHKNGLNYQDVTDRLADKYKSLDINNDDHFDDITLPDLAKYKNLPYLDAVYDNSSSGYSTPRPISRDGNATPRAPSRNGVSTPRPDSRDTRRSDNDEYEVEIDQEFVSSEAPGRPSSSERMTPDDFEPLKILGRGAYAKVYLVRQKATGLLFAMKVLQKASIVVRKKTIEHTKTERNILEDVRHPYIVKLYYAFQTNHRLYLILEYAPGGELFTHLATERMFSEKVASFYAAQMVLALEHLHSLGVVYRDLKPENCLLDVEGHIVVTDFGLSKVGVRTGSGLGSDSPSTSTWCGTPEYMAPEIVQEKPYDSAVDWWSLGCMIQDMLTGSPPFTGQNRKKVMDAICSKKPTFPYYLSADAKDLLTKLLKKDPKNRLGSATCVTGRVKNDNNKSRSRSNSPGTQSPTAAIKNHRFFRHIDWKAMESRQCAPPIVPCVTDPILAENFDVCFTAMPFVHEAVIGNQVDDEDAAHASKAEIGDLHSPFVNMIEGEDISSSLFNGFSYQASPSFISTMERQMSGRGSASINGIDNDDNDDNDDSDLEDDK